MKRGACQPPHPSEREQRENTTLVSDDEEKREIPRALPPPRGNGPCHFLCLPPPWGLRLLLEQASPPAVDHCIPGGAESEHVGRQLPGHAESSSDAPLWEDPPRHHRSPQG